MTFEETLVNTIETSTGLDCYPLEKPQNINTPVLVYKRLTTVRERILGDKSTFNRVRMSLTIYGNTYTAVRAAVSTLNNLLDENTTVFSFSYLVDQKDFKDSETGLYYTYLEYVIFGHLD